MANSVSNAPQATAAAGPVTRSGRVLVTGDGTTSSKTVTFSTPFPTACDAVVFVSNSSGSVTTSTVFIVGGASTSAFTISAGTAIWTNGATFGFEYIAFGH